MTSSSSSGETMKARKVSSSELGSIAAEPWVDRTRRPYVLNGYAWVPVRDGCAWDEDLPERAGDPRGYQRLGDLLIFHGERPSEAEVDGAIRRCHPRGVLWTRTHHGVMRIPETTLLYGEAGEVLHRENGSRYWLDPQQVMFSQGNRSEKARLSAAVSPGERVADMCAGIGYFSVPLGRAGATVDAFELNPVSYRYLLRNIRENRLEGSVRGFLGDCRALISGVYDRLLIGHFEGITMFEAALAHARTGSVIHLHALEDQSDQVLALAAKAGFSAEVSVRVVKKYGPYRVHLVQDVVLG
jgi:tRNA wybutosine-synthesizing protein 2